MSTSDARPVDAGADADARTGDPAPTPTPPALYTVNRSQDGAQVRAELSLSNAQSECATLNAQARMQVGLTKPVYDERGGLVRAAQPIMASMFHGQASQYEVRSAAGLVV